MGLQYNSPMFPGILSARLGSGTYFEIFSVERAGQRMALKRPKPALKDDLQIQKMLETEAAVLRALSPHPHFPEFYGSGRDAQGPYSLMERLEGMNLDQALKGNAERGATLSPPEAAGIAHEISMGTVALHSTAIPGIGPAIHGDLKPHNIMVLRDGRVKIIDLSLEGGTLAYMPPERLDSKRREITTDVFAIGLILYELLTNDPFADEATKMEVYFRMKDLRRQLPTFPSAVPQELRSILEKSLKAGLEGGYPDAAAQCRDLAEYLASLTSDQGASQRSRWILRLESNRNERNS